MTKCGFWPVSPFNLSHFMFFILTVWNFLMDCWRSWKCVVGANVGGIVNLGWCWMVELIIWRSAFFSPLGWLNKHTRQSNIRGKLLKWGFIKRGRLFRHGTDSVRHCPKWVNICGYVSRYQCETFNPDIMPTSYMDTWDGAVSCLPLHHHILSSTSIQNFNV